MQISQMRPVGLGVLEDDGSKWVSKHEAVASSTPLRLHLLTLRTLMKHEDVLRSAKIYDVVWAFKDHFNWRIGRL